MNVSQSLQGRTSLTKISNQCGTSTFLEDLSGNQRLFIEWISALLQIWKEDVV